MTIWEQITKNLRERKGEFTGLDPKQLGKAIMQTNKGKGTKVSSPTSYRTHTDEGNTDIGLTSGEAEEVESTAIRDIEYDPETQNAKVRYTTGDRQYDFPMTPEEYKDFLTSPSKGHWLYYSARRY